MLFSIITIISGLAITRYAKKKVFINRIKYITTPTDKPDIVTANNTPSHSEPKNNCHSLIQAIRMK